MSGETIMRTVAFVGFAAQTNRAAYDLPETTEVWTLNHGHKFGWRVDLLLDIHPRALIEHESYYQPDTRALHLDYLSQPHSCSIYMIEAHPDFPASVPYPLGDALKLAGGKRFRSSFDYMAALAILKGVHRVEVYGFEMKYDTEYRYQKPSALYWIGRMEGAGIEVDAPELLPEAKLYGYEAIQMVSRQTLDAHKAGYEKQLKDNLAAMNRWKGVFLASANNGNADEAAQNVRRYEIQAAMAQAVIDSTQHLIDTCDLPEDVYEAVRV